MDLSSFIHKIQDYIAPNHEQKLEDLGKMETWQRAEFIEKGGRDKMPGQEKAGSSVAQACAKGLEVLIKK